MEYGVILMRAQPIHKGHIDIIKQALEENEKVLVVIGSSNKSGTKRNPLPIDTRILLIKDSLRDYNLSKKVILMPLPDWSTEDAYQYAKEWGNFFYYNIVRILERKTFTMYYNDDPDIVKNWFIKEISERITIKHAERKRDVSGTKIRQAFEENNDQYLKEMLCPSTYKLKNEIKQMLIQCSEEDFIMQ